jgi:uncharacterized LabA/DUF88 family protein
MQSAILNYLGGKIVVMIDAANLESSVKELGWWVDYSKLRELFDGNILVDIRFYSVHHGTDSQDKFFTFLKRHGYTLVTKPLKIIKQADIEAGDIRKANFDVEIAVDAVEMQDRFDTFILFSGDSDFDYLLQFLKKRNKTTIVVSAKHHVAKELIETSDKYIGLKKLRLVIERKRQI